MKRPITCGAALLALVCARPVPAADVHIGINLGVPPPPSIVIPAPPQLVVVPSTPAVRYAPDVGVNLFFYGGRYYTFHEGGWFAAPVYNGPWVYVQPVRVPRPLLVVPARYYRIPPGHLERAYGPPHGKHHGHHDEDDDHRGREHGHGKHDD